MEDALPRWPSLSGMPSDSEMFRFSLDAGDVTCVLDTQSGERVESWRGPACWHLRLFFQGMLHKASNLTCRFWDWSNFQSSIWVILGWPQEDGVMLVLVKCESWAMWYPFAQIHLLQQGLQSGNDGDVFLSNNQGPSKFRWKLYKWNWRAPSPLFLLDKIQMNLIQLVCQKLEGISGYFGAPDFETQLFSEYNKTTDHLTIDIYRGAWIDPQIWILAIFWYFLIWPTMLESYHLWGSEGYM